MSGRRLTGTATIFTGAILAGGWITTAAVALEVPAYEKAKLKACEKQICTIILKKNLWQRLELRYRADLAEVKNRQRRERKEHLLDVR